MKRVQPAWGSSTDGLGDNQPSGDFRAQPVDPRHVGSPPSGGGIPVQPSNGGGTPAENPLAGGSSSANGSFAVSEMSEGPGLQQEVPDQYDLCAVCGKRGVLRSTGACRQCGTGAAASGGASAISPVPDVSSASEVSQRLSEKLPKKLKNARCSFLLLALAQDYFNPSLLDDSQNEILDELHHDDQRKLARNAGLGTGALNGVTKTVLAGRIALASGGSQAIPPTVGIVGSIASPILTGFGSILATIKAYHSHKSLKKSQELLNILDIAIPEFKKKGAHGAIFFLGSLKLLIQARANKHEVSVMNSGVAFAMSFSSLFCQLASSPAIVGATSVAILGIPAFLPPCFLAVSILATVATFGHEKLTNSNTCKELKKNGVDIEAMRGNSENNLARTLFALIEDVMEYKVRSTSYSCFNRCRCSPSASLSDLGVDEFIQYVLTIFLLFCHFSGYEGTRVDTDLFGFARKLNEELGVFSLDEKFKAAYQGGGALDYDALYDMIARTYDYISYLVR